MLRVRLRLRVRVRVRVRLMVVVIRRLPLLLIVCHRCDGRRTRGGV